MPLVADIVEIVAPESAGAGEIVQAHVKVKNLGGYSNYIVITGVLEHDTTQLPFESGYLEVAPQEIAAFTVEFTMPSKGVKLTVYSWYWTGANWGDTYDDSAAVNVSLAEEARAASIIAKILRYDGLDVPIPAPNVPQGTSVEIRATVRNDMATAQKLGIGIVVWDPSGTTVFTDAHYETWSTGPGQTQQFVARPQLLLQKAGQYQVWIGAYVHPEGVVTADSFQGILCTTMPQEVPTGLRNTSLDTVYGTYDPLATVPYVLRHEYKGKAQSGTLQIELGIGVYPWFTPEVALDPVAYSFGKKDDWGWVTENRSFRVPDTVRRGQTYSARVTLQTAAGIADNDIDYTALKVSDPAVPTTDLRDLALTVSYGEYDQGDSLPVRLSYRYQGAAQSGQVSVIIGKGIVFSPVYTYAPKPVSFAHADELTTRSEDIEVTLPKILEPGQVYSVKVVLETSDGKTADQTKGSAFRIASTAIPEDPGVGQYRVVKDYAYPAAETYAGQASQVTYELTVPMAQLEIIGDWLSKRIIDAHEDEVKKHGSQMLHLKVSERERGLTSKDYLVVATATAPKETAGQEYTPQGIVSLVRVTPLGVPLLAWVAIIGVILIVLGFVVQAVIKETRTFLWGEDGVPPEGFGESVVMLLALGLMIPVLGMVQEQTRETYEKPGAPKRPKPYTEAALKAARGAVRLAEKGVDLVGKEIGHIRERKATADVDERRLLERREQEKQRKLEEAQEDLRRRRKERDEIERWS